MGLRNLFTLLLFGMTALPAQAAFDCGRLRNVEPADAYKVEPRHIQECLNRGFDPPVNWRPDRGRGGRANASGGGGFSNLGGLQAPDQPPAVRGFDTSVSKAKMRFALSFPPWAGFPCQLPGGFDICGGDDDDGTTNDPTVGTGGTGGGGTSPTTGGTSGGESSCPAANDNTGTFGVKQAVGSTGGYTLTCGGAVPLTTYQMGLSKSAEFLVATEHNSPYIWIYRRSGNGFSGASQPTALPTFLCRPTGPKGEMEESLALPGPRAQFIAYGAGTTSIALRLTANPGNEAIDNLSSLSPLNNQEKYLHIPVQGGVPQVPANCAEETQYYRTTSNPGGSIIIETALEPGCEASAAQCAKVGVSTNPSATANCDTVSVHLSGGTASNPASETCKDMTQMMVVDRPNLLHAPGQSAKFASISGRTATMAATSAGSVVYLPADNIIRVPQSSESFVLPEGGSLGLPNGTLFMYGPATVSPGTGQVVMTEGGEFRDAAGNTISTYGKNSGMSPSGGYPWMVQAARSIVLPVGYELPTQPSPYIRAPLTAP